jgi:DNA-binding NarL/FixJ family response regulator
VTTSAKEETIAPREIGAADVVLVSAEGAGDAVAAILEEQGLAYRAVARPTDLDASAAPAVVVLAVSGPLAAARSELEALTAAVPAAAVLVVCEDLRPGELRTALGSGAAGVVLRGQASRTLAPSLEAARVGQVTVPRRQARQVEAAALSPREKQILGLVVMGYMNGEIASRLFLAESTVKSHLSSAFAKLGVRSRNEAVDLIVDPGRGLGMGILALGGEPMTVDSGPGE